MTETLTDLVNGNTFSTTYDDVNLAQTLGSDTAYVGFSAATGGGVSTQTVSDFTFTAEAPPPPPPVDTWTGTGDWVNDAAADWSTGSPPNTGDQATIASGQAQINSDLTLDGNTIQNNAEIDIGVTSGAIVTLDDGAAITGGVLVIGDGQSGTIEIESGSGSGATFDGLTVDNFGTLQIDATLTIADTVTLQDGGIVSMASGSQIAEPSTDWGSIVTLDNVDNTIEGAGTIGNHDDFLVLTNSGTVDANISGETLSIDTADDEGNSSTLTNTGTLQAENGGELSVHSIVDNTDGSVVASGGFVDFELGITGGTATISSGGTLQYGWSSDVATVFDGPGTLVLNNQNQEDQNFTIPSYTIGETTFSTASYIGTVSGFGTGDTIDVTDLAYASNETATWDQTNGILTITSGPQTASIDLAGTYSQNSFALTADSSGGTDVIANPATVTFASGIDGSDGNAIQGEALTVNVTDADNGADLGAIAYTWFDNGQIVEGDTDNSYTPTAGDAENNNPIDVLVSFTDPNTGNIDQVSLLTAGTEAPPLPSINTWNGVGDWVNDASADWSAGSPPNPGDQATVASGQAQINSDLTLDGNAIQNNAEIDIGVTSGAIVTLDDGATITGGTLVIGDGQNGELKIEANGTNISGATLDNVTVSNSGGVQVDDAATLTIAGTVTLEGGGTVSLAGTGDPTAIVGQLDQSENPASLDNIDNTISGIGTIGDGTGDLVLTNEAAGVVDASGGTITLDTGSTDSNAGLMEATNGGTLAIDDDLNNSGTVLADGGTVVVSFGASPGLGGTGSVTIAGGGGVDLVGDASQNITFAGPGTLEASSNHGTITGFGTGDVYDLLDDDPYTPGQTAVWTQTATGSGAGGTLQIYSSSHSLEATLDLAGTYTTADFALAPDSPSEGAGTEVVFNSPDYWGSFTTQLTPGVHLQGGDLQNDGLAEVAAVLYSSVSEYNPIGDPAGPYSVTRELLPLDPFLLPILDGAQVVVPATDLTLPAKAKVILPNISAGESVSPEGIGVGVTQVDGNNVIDQVVVTANGDAPLTVGSPTPLESGSDTASTIYNLDLSFRNDNSTPTTDIPYLSTYAVAWDQYNSGTYTIDFQVFNADGSASSGVVTPEAFTKFNGESISATPGTNEATNLPAWEFRNGGGIYALAIAASSGDEDVVQFLGYNLNGTRNTTDSADLKSFTILPHLAAYSGNDPTNEITQDVIPSLSPFPGAPSQQLEFAQVSANNASDWVVGWNETVTNAGTGAFLGDQVEFAVVKPGVTNPILQYTDQLSDAQNIRVATYTDASGHDFVVFAYGDATATHLVEFQISNSGGTANEIASVTDPTTQPFTDVTSLGNGLFAVEYDNVVGPGETSQFDYKIFDFATTGLNNPTLSTTEANYIVGTHFDDVVTGANGVNNLYYFVGDAAGGAAPSDTFHGGSGGWNIAIFADARSDYTISTLIENGEPNVTTITSDGADPAHTGSLAVTNVEFLAFDPAGDPTPQNGTIDVNGGTFVILGGSNAVTIEAGATAEIDAAASGQASYTGNVTFAGATGTVQVDQLNGLTGPISGISGSGNVLDLDGFNAQQGDVFAVTPDHTGSVTLLTVTDTTNNTSETVTLNGDYAPDNNVAWSSSYDGHGGVDVVDPPLTSANAGSLGFLPNDEQITFESNGETIYTIDSALTAATGTNQGAQISNANVVVGGPGNDTFRVPAGPRRRDHREFQSAAGQARARSLRRRANRPGIAVIDHHRCARRCAHQSRPRRQRYARQYDNHPIAAGDPGQSRAVALDGGRRSSALQHPRNAEAFDFAEHGGEILLPGAEMAFRIGQRDRVHAVKLIMLVVHQAAVADQRP